MSCIFGGLNLVRVNYLCAFLFLRVLLLLRFVTFWRVLDAEMKEATQMGVTLKTTGDEKEAVNSEEELFWSKGLFGLSSAKSLLNTVYFYNGKLFGLRASEHRNNTLGNI